MIKIQPPQSLLLLGGPAAGKTHYGGQLLGRLQDGRSRLQLRTTSSSITPFEEALKRLGQGLAASHTATHLYDEIVLSVDAPSGGPIDLIWPDYGGEQIKHLLERRQISQEWRERIERGVGWLLFIRLDQITKYDDVISRPRADLPEEPLPSQGHVDWSSQADLVELLQLLLYVKGVDLLRRVARPALVVALSCWDELDSSAQNVLPATLLRQRLPLFAAFLEATWIPSELVTIGLSSLGKSLHDDEPDAEYRDKGPEYFGYVVLPDGKHSSDLTLPITMLMERGA